MFVFSIKHKILFIVSGANSKLINKNGGKTGDVGQPSDSLSSVLQRYIYNAKMHINAIENNNFYG